MTVGEAKRRRDLADTISVLIPERGRPEMLERCIQSLLDTAGDDHRIEILVAIDDDDPAWIDREPIPMPRTRYFRWPRAITLGEKLNRLGQEAAGGIFWFIANDYIVETLGWPAKFREAVANLPNGIGVPFPRDDLHPNHASFPIITRRMQEAIGFLFPPCYPYWFIDTTWDQHGIMLGQRFEIDVTVRAPEGRGLSHGLYELQFWVSFWEAMAPVRLREAAQLIAAAYGHGTPAFQTVMQDIPRRQQICKARTAHLSTPEFLAEWGSRSESPPAPRYQEVRTFAEQMMEKLKKGAPRKPKVAIATPSGRQWEATTGVCIASVAAQTTLAGVSIGLVNVQTSMISHGRNATVAMCLEQGFDYIFWIDADMKLPATILMDLLRCDKDIVGATYNRRVAPYETLGRMKGPKPSESALRSGLIEAEALPGGVILVKTDVYRALKWPWYFESYRWDAPNGLDAFEGLLRDYFRTLPPAEAVAEFRETALAKWMADGYEVGLDPGARDRLSSEDINFCKKATRAGFQIWCSLDATFEVGHIGEQVVTCDRPPEALKEAAD